MVRETRYLYVGNLPDHATEEQITDYFGRHGRIQSVKLIPSVAVENNDKRSSTSTCCAVVAFMDIRSAARAHEFDNIINGARVITQYNESSSAVTCTPLQNSVPNAASVHGAYFVASSRTLDSCSTSSSKPGCLSPTASGAPLTSLPMVQATVPTAAAGPPGCNAVSATVSGTSSIVGGLSRTHSSSSHVVVSGAVMSSGRGEGSNGPVSADHDSVSSSAVRIRSSRRSTTPTSPHGVASFGAGSNSHRHRRPARRTHRHYDHHHRLAGGNGPSPGSAGVPVLLPSTALGSGGGSVSGVLLTSSGRALTTGSSYHPAAAELVAVCRSRSGSLSPPDTGRSLSQGSSCSGSHSHDIDVDRRLLLSNSGAGFHGDCHVRTAGSDSSGVSSSGSNGGGGSDPRKPRGMLIRGFPHRSTDSSIRDGLFHEYKKYGKVTSVSIVGTGDERHAIVSFKKHEDAVKALEASHEKRFFGSKVSVSIHDGVEVENCEFRAPEAELDEYHHKATRTLFVGNLDKSVAKDMLRDIFAKFGQIVEIEIKNQSGQSLSYAFIQFDNIRSVVTALREMDGEHIGGSKIKLGFGKSMQTTCVWLDGVADTVSEKYLFEQFYRHGNVTSTYIDRKTSRGLVFFESVEQAQRAVTAMRGVPIKDKIIQIDFASRDCQNLFFENMERTGQLRLGDRAEDRAARGYTGFTDYQRRPNPNRRSDSFIDGQRPNDRFPEYNSAGRVLAAPARVSSYGTSRGSSRSYLTSAPTTPTGTRPDSTRGPFYDGYDRRESSVASTRVGQKYFDDRAGVITPDEVNFISADAYEQDLKDYGYSQRSDDALDRRKLYRSADSPGGVPHVSAAGTGNGRYPSATHDDVFVERLESKSQPEWECNSRSGHKTASSLSTTKVDDRLSSRTQRSYSPSDSDTVSQKSRTVAPSRSRTSQSISPHRHRHSKERKDQSPARDCSWQPEDYQTSTRRSSKGSPDRFSTRSAEPLARSSSSFNKGHSVSGVESSKLRTRGTVLDDDHVVLSDRDRSSKIHRSMTAFEDYTVTVSNDGERRRLDKDVGVTPIRTDTVRSVVNLTSTWRYDTNYTDYKSSRSEQYVEQPVLVSSNHIGVLSRISRPDRGPDAGSGSSTPRSKSPVGSDAEESVSGERTASKGSGDEVASLEKEKYHLLSMLKELEEYSSGGSEMDGRDEVSRAALIRMRMEEVIDLENESAEHRPQLISDIMQRRLAAVDSVRSHSNAKYDRQRKSNVDVDETLSTCQQIGENHLVTSYDAEDEVVDLVSDSPGITDIPSECRRRISSDLHGVVVNSCERLQKGRRSYRPRWSGESAESASEESCVAISPPGHNKVNLRPSSEDNVTKVDTTGRVSSLISSSTSVRAPVSEDNTLSGVCRVSSTGSVRKGSCASTSDHQPCIIPDSLVTTSGSNVRVPTEPRTVQSSASQSGVAGRVPMSLPLPRFAYELKLARQNVNSASADSVRSVSKDENVASTTSCVVVDVRPKEDVLAPFSPGLMSPTVICLAPSKSESVSSTSVVEPSPQALSQDYVVVKDECLPESTTITDTKTATLSESELTAVNENSVQNKQDGSSVCKSEEVVSVENNTKRELPECDDLNEGNPNGIAGNTDNRDQAISEQSAIPLAVADAGLKTEALTSVPSVSVVENHKEDASCMASDSEVSDLLSPGSPPEGTQSLEERIRALDEKLNIYNQKTRQVSIPEVVSPSVFDYREKYTIKRRLATGSSVLSLDNQSASAVEQSDIVKSLLARNSIFDQDSRRLEQLKNTAVVSLPSSLLVSDPMSASLLVPRSRLMGVRPIVDLMFPIPLSHSVDQQRQPGIPLSVRTTVTSDLHLSLPSPVPSVIGWSSGVASNSNQTNIIADSASSATVSWAFPSSVNAPAWNQNWSSPLHVGCSTVATPQTPTSQDPSSLRPGTMVSSNSAFCSTPTILVPTDPRRVVRPGDQSGAVLNAGRRQDSHSTETCDAWSLASPITRRDSVAEVPTLPSKPKEMVSPPVSILKRTVPSLLKEDSCSSNSKSCDTSTAVEVTSVPAVSTVAGIKRTAEVAFGKDVVSALTPIKALVKNQKVSSSIPADKESELVVDKKTSSTKSKTSETKKTGTLKSTSTSSVKVDSKKSESLFSNPSLKVESSKSHVNDDVLKNSVSKTNKSHSNSLSSAVKAQSQKESKSVESAIKDIKPHTEKSSDGYKDAVLESDTSKEDKWAVKSNSNHVKPKTNQSKDVSVVKDVKDKPAVDKERTSDEKDKSKSTHSNSRHSSLPENRHVEKSRDKKLEDNSISSKQLDTSVGAVKNASSKSSGSSTLSRSTSKPSSKETPKASDKSSNKTKEMDLNSKDVPAHAPKAASALSTGTKAADSTKSADSKAPESGKTVESKACDVSKASDLKDKKTEKDDTHHIEKPSRPSGSSSKSNKSTDDSVLGKSGKSGLKESSSTKSKPSDSAQSASSGKQTLDSSRKSESTEKDKAKKTSSSDKTSKSSKRSESSSRSKAEKRPEEKREVKALLQEFSDDMLPPYQSMYDMVKRRSNKEREKENLMMKTLESRAKSLSRIAKASQRRNTGSNSSRNVGSEFSDDETSRSDRSRRRSAEPSRASGSAKQSTSRLDSSSDSESSDSSSSAASKDSDVKGSRNSKSAAPSSSGSALKSHSHVIMSSSDSHDSSDDNDDDQFVGGKSRNASSNKGRRSAPAAAPSSSQRTAIYTSSSSSSNNSDDDSNSASASKTKKMKSANLAQSNKSSSKKVSCSSTPKKQASSRSNSSKGSAVKKKQPLKESSSSSASDSDDDSDESEVDKKRKPVKAMKSTIRKTPNKSALIDSSGGDSDSESTANKVGKKVTIKSKETEKVSSAKVIDAVSIPSAMKTQTPGKVESKHAPKGKEEKDEEDVKKKSSVTRSTKSDSANSSSRVKKLPITSTTLQPSAKTTQDVVTKQSESCNKLDEKVPDIQTTVDMDIAKSKHLSEKNMQTAKPEPKTSEHEVKPQSEAGAKSTSEQQKLATRKKTVEISTKPPSKKCKLEDSKAPAHHSVETEREESITNRTDNIFEKMEKPEIIDKPEREMENLLHLPEPAIEGKAIVVTALVSDTATVLAEVVESKVPVFLPADEDRLDLSVETTKLTVERLKEESSKEQTIEEAVKTIMDLTPSAATEEAAPMRQVNDMDSSSSMIEETSNSMVIGDASLSDDAGELNAAIESLLEKELEPSDDLTDMPLQQDTKSSVTVMEVDDVERRPDLVTEECLTNYGVLEKRSEDPGSFADHKGVGIVSKEEELFAHQDKATAVGIIPEAVDLAMKSDLDSSPWNMRHHRPSDENVENFLTRISQVNADIVTDFGALSKTNGPSSNKASEINLPSIKLNQSGRLFGSQIPQLKTDLECINGSMSLSFLVKKENEVVEPPVEAPHNNHVKTEIVPVEPLSVVLNTCETEGKLQNDDVLSSEDKILVVDDALCQPIVVRKDERTDAVVTAATSDELNTSADLYEFKDDDDEEVKHPLHKRSRKRPGDSDSSEAGVGEATHEHKRSRKRANSATAKVDSSVVAAAVAPTDNKAVVTELSAVTMPVEIAVENSPQMAPATSASPSVAVASTETVFAATSGDNESWQAHMDSIIDAVARGNFQRGDESDYYATTTVQGSGPTRRQRTRRPQAPKTPVATSSLPVASTPSISASVPSSCLASAQQGSPSMYNTSVPSSFVLTSVGAPSIQRSVASVPPSGKASPKIITSQPQTILHPSQMVMPPRMYAPVSTAIMVTACGPNLIGGALSPGNNGGPLGYQLLMTRPMMNDGHGQQFITTSVAATTEQQRRIYAAHHPLSSPGSSSGHGVMDMSVTQPLLVTVSRAGLGSGATPSPVIPGDTGHPQLRGVVPQTAAVQPPSAPTVSQSHLHGIRLETGLLQPITDQSFRAQFGIASIPMSSSCSASNSASLRFAADTVTASINKSTAPLDILVSADMGLSKVRHMSPDIAQGLLQSLGQFSPHLSTGAYVGHISRPPHSFPQPQSNFPYMTPSEAATGGPRRSSPVQSDLREALQQPSRLVQQEQLLQKQRFSVPGAVSQQQPLSSAQMCSPQASGVIIPTAVIGNAALAGGGSSDNSSPQITLGQHRMPTRVPEPRTNMRAEPKSLVNVNAQASISSLSSPVSTAESPVTSGSSVSMSGVLHRQLATSEILVPHSLAADLSGGGGSVAGRMEPPRSASAMLSSHGAAGAAGMAPMDFFISPGVVAPMMLPSHPLMLHHPQQPPDVAMQRFHQRPPPPGLVLPFVPGANQGGGLPPQQASAIIGPPITPNMTDIQQADNLVVNTKQFTDALQRFQSVWHGHLVLKNDIATVSMHFIAGNQGLIPASLPLPTSPQDLANGMPPQLRIGQRMRLDPSQLDQVSKRMLNNGDFSMLLAVPSSRDAVESMTQTHTLQTGFINYLLQKQAAGIVNIQDPTNNQAAYVVHIFPPCSFSEQNLNRFVPDIVQNCAGATYLMIVITTC